MDFLDSLDLDVSNKRSRRVRSWYLYEQFKSLERNQIDAAQRLKDRSYQDRLLRKELSERKERRKLYDQFGTSQSESRIERSVKSEDATTALSADDFYETYDQYRLTTTASDHLSEISNDKFCDDDFKSVDDHKDDESNVDSVNSVVNIKSEETITAYTEKDVCVEKYDMVDELNQYFDEVKDNLERIEKMTEIDDEKAFENNSLYSIEEVEMPPVGLMDKKNLNICDNNVLAMWTKLVSFAYQIIQLNHGNCYYDYGSQFLTAVLACDVLRRGINTMCHILQPYVSPIKFATDSNSSSDIRSVRRKKSLQPHRYRCTEKLHKNFSNQITRKHRSENWQHCSGYSAENRRNESKDRRASEPWRNTHKFSLDKGNPSKSDKASYSSDWPDFSNDDSTEQFFRESFKCPCYNPMVKLSQYFDSVLKEIDESMLG